MKAWVDEGPFVLCTQRCRAADARVIGRAFPQVHEARFRNGSCAEIVTSNVDLARYE
jgi:hypothetical protein